MPQAATLKSLPRAFRMTKAMQAQGIEWGGDYRGAADRRNGSYRRWPMTELGEIEISVPAHAKLQRARGWCAPTPGARPTSTA